MDVVGGEIDPTTQKQGKTDLIFTGKSGTHYLIQAKNSFQDMFNQLGKFYPARFNDPIKLQTLMNQIVDKNIISVFDAKELEYAMLNLEFLSRFSMNEETISKKAAIQTQHFISQLLINSLLYFFGADNREKIIEDTKKFSFVILANRYLIPYSFFLEAVRDGIKDIYKQAILNINKPKITIDNMNQQMANELYTQKKEIIKYLPPGYNYPPELISIGANAGENLLSGASISGIHITFNIDALQKRFLKLAKEGV